MNILIYPKCSTCKKAIKWLNEEGVDYTIRHIVEEPLSVSEIKMIHELSKEPIKKFFNTSGMKYRELNLKDKLSKMLNSTTHDKNICLLGYTNKMNDILASIDVLISKPGGLTTTEALLSDVPMIVPYFIPGQEEENLDFLTNCGAALRTTKKYSLPVLLKVLIDDPSRLDMLKENIKSIKKFNSAINISDLVADILSNNE